MASTIFEHSRMNVTSYTGPSNTLERTRVRLQFEVNVIDPTTAGSSALASLGFNDVVVLYNVLDRWIADHRGKEGS